MNGNNAPVDVLHKASGLAIALRIGFVINLWLAVSEWYEGRPTAIFFVGSAGFFTLFFLFLEVQTITFHDTYVSINYLLRKRLIVHSDIDYVSLEERRNWNSTLGLMTYDFVSLRLRNGRKINLGGFKEGTQMLYQKLKACEGTNEEFLRGR